MALYAWSKLYNTPVLYHLISVRALHELCSSTQRARAAFHCLTEPVPRDGPRWWSGLSHAKLFSLLHEDLREPSIGTR